MQQEDDLRGLAKVMEFMRAISIIFIVVHIYWFCYQAIVDMGINIGVVDKIGRASCREKCRSRWSPYH